MPLDHDTCVRLLIRERVKLIGYIRAIVGHTDTAEDVFQQLSVLVLNKHDEIESTDHFMGWMRRAARLESLNTVRKIKRAPLSLDPGVAEMLVQSHERNAIRLLPALPDAWPEGFISGLRTRGGHTVDIEWQHGRLTEATLHATTRGPVIVRYGDRQEIVVFREGQSITLGRDLLPKNEQ